MDNAQLLQAITTMFEENNKRFDSLEQEISGIKLTIENDIK